MTEIVGNHPYADEFPMASEDELVELAESISTVGLIHPLVLTPDGLVLDGRNRREACERAGVEPDVEIREGTDDDYKEFVIGVNTTGRRESMTVQIAAASSALILGEDRRRNGRWIGWSNGTLQSSVKSRAESEALRCVGLVLDVLGRDPLGQVRDGSQSLNAVYEFAIAKRDEQRNNLERQERIEVEEAEAKSFIESNAPDLADQVGDVFESYAEAQAVWGKRNREEAARIAREKAEKAAHEKAERDNAEDRVRAFLGSLMRLEPLDTPDQREWTANAVSRYPEAAPPTQRHLTEPAAIRAIATSLNTYAQELENNNGA